MSQPSPAKPVTLEPRDHRIEPHRRDRHARDAPARTQFQVIWKEMVAFALSAPTAFAFIELHNHASYLDAESIAIERNVKVFAHGMIERAQREGLVKPLDAYVLMELMFGAFVGMMRAHWEGRIALTDGVIRDAEQACWDAVAVHAA